MPNSSEGSKTRSFHSRSGLKIDRIVHPGSVTSPVEEPGQFPYTRGVQENMYRGRLWTMRQYAGFGTPELSNERYKYLIKNGVTGLSIAFDLPTQLGYDPDHVRSHGEVGKVGVSVACLDDMRILFDGIDQSKISTSMTINATAPILLAFYVALARERGVSVAELRGTIQNDILKEYVARGNFIVPPNGALRLITDVFEWCGKECPKWNTISISGYHIREAGSTAIEELAFTFANAITYVESALARGLSLEQFAGQLSFFFNVHNDFFEEICKFRAARRIWAKIMKDRFGAKNPKSMMMRFHSQTAGSTLTAQQPENNIVRVSYQAMAAVLGGTQSLHTNSFDEALALPTEASAQLALRTQQILAYETNVTASVDPLAGSYFIEDLTNRIEDSVTKLLKDIEGRGGTVVNIENGYIQSCILNSAYRDQKEMDSGDILVVGVNQFMTPKESGAHSPQLLKIDEISAERSRERVQKLRKKRDPNQWSLSMKNLLTGLRGTENSMELILEAVTAGATLGEISAQLRDVYGEYREKSGL